VTSLAATNTVVPAPRSESRCPISGAVAAPPAPRAVDPAEAEEFDVAGVTLADHHSESRRFLTHVARESGSQPARVGVSVTSCRGREARHLAGAPAELGHGLVAHPDGDVV
jgi:hypothetical protein